MLVVAHQGTARVGRESGLPCSGESEEQSRFLAVCIGRAVHRQESFSRQNVIHDGENSLLDFTCVVGAPNDHQTAVESEDDESVGVGAVVPRLGSQVGRVEYGVLRDV